jgi:hypothetical protein
MALAKKVSKMYRFICIDDQQVITYPMEPSFAAVVLTVKINVKILKYVGLIDR